MTGEEPTKQPVFVYLDDVSVVYTSHRAELLRGSRIPARRKRTYIHALTDISFHLRKGDCLGVIGHNGAGKSTLLSAISGSIACSSGRLLVRSQPRSLAGSSSTINRKLSGRENIHLGLLSLGIDPEQIDDLEPEIVDFAELGEFIDMPAKTYSSGMRARLQFAIRTTQDPEILLLDEALSVGDQHFKEKSMNRINDIREQAGVVVLATHSMREVLSSCTHALWLRDGRVAAFGEPESVVESYEQDSGPRRDTITE